MRGNFAVVKPSSGDPAPLFSAPVAGDGYADDATISLVELQGERVVLVFYPKDDTPGCSRQACALRDNWTGVKSKARIFGVSIDSVKKHRRFIAKYELPYPLIADEDQSIVNSYGVWVEKSMYGKKFMGTERTTFVIGLNGRIETILEKVSPEKHLELLEKALA